MFTSSPYTMKNQRLLPERCCGVTLTLLGAAALARFAAPLIQTKKDIS
jgi:hypothetical protein